MNSSIAGAVELLDKHFDGRQWVNDIDLDNFDIGNGHNCILGQLFSEFTLGVTKLEGNFEEMFDLGFNIRLRNYTKDKLALELVWIDFIRRSRNGETV